MNIPTKITDKEMKDAVSRSGYLIEQRIAAILEDDYFVVRPNTTYPDPVTGKTREIDLEAYRTASLGKTNSIIWFYIFIECENNPQPILMFRKNPFNEMGSNYRHLSFSGIPSYYFKKARGNKYLIEDLFQHGNLSIVKNVPIASQYCSFSRKNENSKWFATHNEEQHNSFQSLANIVWFRMKEHFKHVESRINSRNAFFDFTFYFPVVVLENSVKLAELKNKDLVFHDVNHVRYTRSFHVDGDDEVLNFNVVTEAGFEGFLSSLKDTMKKIEVTARLNYDRLRLSSKDQIKEYEDKENKVSFMHFLRRE